MTKFISTWRQLMFGIIFGACVALASSNASALGSTPVTVVNPADIAKAEGIQQPFASETNCASETSGNCNAKFQVSASARWVIETVGFNCSGQQFANVNAVIFTIVTGGVGVQQLVATPLNFNGSGVLQSAQNVRFYADAGSFLFAEVASDAATIDCFFSLSGQQVAVP